MIKQITLDKELINSCSRADHDFEVVQKLLSTKIFAKDILRRSMNAAIYSMGEKTVDLLADYIEFPKFKVSNSYFNNSQLKILNWKYEDYPEGGEGFSALEINITDYIAKMQKISRKHKLKELANG